MLQDLVSRGCIETPVSPGDASPAELLDATCALVAAQQRIEQQYRETRERLDLAMQNTDANSSASTPCTWPTRASSSSSTTWTMEVSDTARIPFSGDYT